MNLDKLKAQELVALYNKTAEALGEKPVKRFADKKSAIRRTTEILARQKKVEKQAQSKPKATRKPRGMRFIFRPEEEIRACKGSIKSKSGDTRTLRQRAVDLLLTGATFPEIKVMIRQFDKDRGVETAHLERRAYELVRLVHYYLGYGLRQTDEGVITAYTEDKQRDQAKAIAAKSLHPHQTKAMAGIAKQTTRVVLEH